MPKGDHLKQMKVYNAQRIVDGKEKLSRTEYFKRRKEGTLNEKAKTETPTETNQEVTENA